MHKLIKHPNRSKYLYAEIHVRISDFKHCIFEEHVFYDVRTYRGFILDNLTMADFKDRSWVAGCDSITVTEDYEKELV